MKKITSPSRRDPALCAAAGPRAPHGRHRLIRLFTRRSHIVLLALSSLFFFALVVLPPAAFGNCSLTSLGFKPLPDLGSGTYKGFEGGLYPNGSNTKPAEHAAAGLAAAAQIKPLNATGNFDNNRGTIGFVSIGLSNTTAEFDSGGENAFKPRADADPSKNPKVTLVDGAQGGKNASEWADPNDSAWTVLAQRLADAGITASQVEVVWLKLALEYPQNYGDFPLHAQVLQTDIEIVLRRLKSLYPNLQIAYLSSRTRSYTEDLTALNGEPYAYESGFSVQWMIANQINGVGDLNFDASKGPVVAPYLTWGPYLWADGTTPRSDGFTWLCSDLSSDFVHPASGGVEKVADQLLAYFKTDPTAIPWFLKKDSGTSLSVTGLAAPASGPAGFATQFSANATGGSVASYSWTFDDGTFANVQNPVKSFPVPGTYNVHLTVTSSTGDYATTVVPIVVGPPVDALLNVSARLQVGLADQVGITGFIVDGSGTKRVVLRAIGPSLTPLGVAGALADPYLELHDSAGLTIAANDNWNRTQIGGLISGDQVAEIQAAGFTPVHPAESAMIVNLGPGSYTTVIRGASGETGVGLAELYDLDQGAPATVANLSTRGLVQTGANVLIGGFIVGGTDPSDIILRAIGPSLASVGVTGALLDPTLELHDANGFLVTSNDNWADTQADEIQASGLAPSDPREAAIKANLVPGGYTATVAGKNGGVGVGLVEVFRIP